MDQPNNYCHLCKKEKAVVYTDNRGYCIVCDAILTTEKIEEKRPGKKSSQLLNNPF